MKSSGNSALDRACEAIERMAKVQNLARPALIRLGFRARRMAVQRRRDGRRSKVVEQFYLRQAHAIEARAQGFVR